MQAPPGILARLVSSLMRRATSPAAAAAAFSALFAATAISCGPASQPLSGTNGSGATSGFPVAATKNTTRVSSQGAPGTAAAVSLAVWPGAGQRPRSVALVPSDWRSALAATPLVAAPTRSALLFAPDGDVPDVTQSALGRLDPTGVASAGNVRRIVIADAGDPGNSKPVSADDPATLADAVDRSRIGAGAPLGSAVVVVGEGEAAWALPAAGWAARSGSPVLFTKRDAVPAATAAAIKRRGKPVIILLAPLSEASAGVERQLGTLGAVQRVTGDDPTLASIAFARYRDGDIGWGVVDSGHGLVFAPQDKPLEAIGSAPLSGAGTYGPLLVTPPGKGLPASLKSYLLDIQPGYRGDPSRGVYNHGWLIGDTSVYSEQVQAAIDGLLEIQPAKEQRNP